MENKEGICILCNELDSYLILAGAFVCMNCFTKLTPNEIRAMYKKNIL